MGENIFCATNCKLVEVNFPKTGNHETIQPSNHSKTIINT